jgi:hypothetical protein
MVQIILSSKYFLITPNLRSYLFLIIIFISAGLSGQHSVNTAQLGNSEEVILDDIESLDEYVHLNQELPSEKIFLHLDRPSYIQGDTIWFKAFLWYGYDQIPDTISGVLYVDLINPQGSVMLRRKLQVQNGTAHGDFVLDSTITSGSHFLRAYTRLMHNPNMGDPFNLEIPIIPAGQNIHFECIPVIKKHTGNDSLQLKLKFFEIDPSGNLNRSYTHDIDYSLKIGDQILQQDVISLENTKEYIVSYSLASLHTIDSLADLEISIQDDRMAYENLFHIPLQEYIDLQFFPEGGNLINGLESKVAFKAIGPDGLGREVSGEVRTKDDIVVTRVSSTHKGMGTFMLKPNTNKEYYAHIWFSKRKYVIPLPTASSKGLIMSVTYPNGYDDPYVSIKQNLNGTTELKYIVGSAYGKIWFSAEIKAFQDSSSLKIPTDLLPEGICRLTVLNADFKAECERLIYVNKDQGFEIELTPDSSSYEQRSRVTLHIKAADFGWAPVQAELSIAVLDREQISQNSLHSGIKGYKLLNSELQGYIEDVDTYYENGSWANVNLLDLLLLSQGYRKFAPVSITGDDLKFIPEKSHDITGKIEFTGSKSRKRKFDYQTIKLNLLSLSDDLHLDTSYPDSLGNFRFHLPLTYGNPHIILQANNPKKKPFMGDILLDSPVDLPKFTTLQYEGPRTTSSSEEFISQLQSARKQQRSKKTILDSIPWKLSLEEVQVTAKAKDWYRRYEKDARKIVDLDTLDPYGNRYKDLYDLLVEEFGGIWRTYPWWGLRTVLLPSAQSTILPFHATRKPIMKHSHFPPVYVIDGNIYWNGDGFNITALFALHGFPVNDIKRVLVLPPMSPGVRYYSSTDIYDHPYYIDQSMVVIETYSKNTYRGVPPGIKTFVLDGLDTPREFYSPRYEGPSRKSPVYDGRATIFWEPNIITDSNGEAKLEFYTSDRQTTLDVYVNGIMTESGYPGQGHAQINIKSDD